MKLRLSAVIAAILFAAACGSVDTANTDPTVEDTATATPTTATTATPTGIASGEPIPAKLDVAPGRVGPVHAGMTKAQAAATGFFDTDVKVGSDVCDHVEPLQWKKGYRDFVDVLTTDAGVIGSMGITNTLKTTKGIGIGNTLGQVNAAYGDAVSPAQEAGYNQTGVYVNTGDDWLGFLVNQQFSKVSPASKVTFMEVTKGAKPDLIRDGC